MHTEYTYKIILNNVILTYNNDFEANINFNVNISINSNANVSIISNNITLVFSPCKLRRNMNILKTISISVRTYNYRNRIHVDSLTLRAPNNSKTIENQEQRESSCRKLS